ncbi:hypothetical protein J2Z76_002587 [Sedimentibacter acidaminivorans]|uniref:Uncharacterized protein n=1 Tax=Sedimentibacter acidaminivorans TaxID=913099 RepID=A0ABS4GGG1_9FIRM|nr:hypothetical protein [Sedimentibacter acidaminivorans]
MKIDNEIQNDKTMKSVKIKVERQWCLSFFLSESLYT